MKQTCINAFVCEGERCGSPTYAYVVRTWIFETNKIETRVKCGGCGHLQSEEYSQDLINGKVKPPIAVGDGEGWIYPHNPDYEIWKALMRHNCKTRHEPLLQITIIPFDLKDLQLPPVR